jgi:hypothetical protein
MDDGGYERSFLTGVDCFLANVYSVAIGSERGVEEASQGYQKRTGDAG